MLLARTSKEGGHAPANVAGWARCACPLPYLLVSLVIAFALVSGGCAAFRPTDANGPRADVRLYPVGLVDPAARLEEASLAWYQLSQQYGLQGRTERCHLRDESLVCESMQATARMRNQIRLIMLLPLT